MPDVGAEDVSLILQALEDAAFFRESRASAMERVARKGRRGIVDAPVGEADKKRARDYMALIARLRKK